VRNFMVLQWRVMVVRKTLAGRDYDTYHLRRRDTRVEIIETIDGGFEFRVNERSQTGTNGKHLDASEVDVLLSVWCASDLAEAQQYFSIEKLRAAAALESSPNAPPWPRRDASARNDGVVLREQRGVG
jgi:hypothetical protein